MSKRPFYRFVDQADPAVAEIEIVDFIGDWIDDYIGFGVTARQFVDELSRLPESVKTIRVRINSPGGDVFGALNIANALRSQRAERGRTVETVVDGLAASAATLILMAGDPVRMADNALLMVHNPLACTCGNATQLREDADSLDKVRDTIIATYQWHAELSDEELVALMDAETWMDASEAVERGFATEIVEGLQAAASIDRRAMALAKITVPERFKARVEELLGDPAPEPPPSPAPTPEPPALAAASASEVLRLCREAEVLDLAERLLDEGADVETVQAAVKAEAARRKAENDRQAEIRQLCDAASLTDLADSYIAGGMPAEKVRAQLTVVTARLDQAEVDTGLPPDHGTPRAPRIDVSAIYAELNKRS